MIRWICGVSMKDKRISEELRELVGVEPITNVIKSGRLRWYEHVIRISDEDWVKKSMEHRVDSRRPVGRPVGRHGYRVWKRICHNFRSAEKMPMTERNRGSML